MFCIELDGTSKKPSVLRAESDWLEERILKNLYVIFVTGKLYSNLTIYFVQSKFNNDTYMYMNI